MKAKLRTWGPVALGLFLAVYLLWAWYRPGPVMSPAGFAAAQEERAVRSLLKQEVPVRAVQVLPKAAAVKKLKLPAAVADDPRSEVLAAVEIAPSKGGATAVTMIDTTTGATSTLVREKPRPLISFEAGTEIGMRYGVATDGGTEAVLFGRRDLLRVGSVYVAGYAEVDSDAEGRAMVEISYRW